MLRTLIFDWDGTLHDTKALYGSAFRRAYGWLCENGYAREREFSDGDSAVYLGMTPPDMWHSFMPQLPDGVWQKASAILGEGLTEGISHGNARLYPGAEDTLLHLKAEGYKLIVLSNCKDGYMNAHRNAFDLDRFFSGYYCSGNYGYAPKYEIFESIKAAYPGEYCMIGDRYPDIEVALRHGLHSIGCSYGFGSDVEIKDAEFMAQRVTDIMQIINTIE